MKIIRHFWNNLKTETDIWFFYLFLLTLPFSIRKVITFFPIRDQFNEYTGTYLYLSDTFLILTLFSWFIILCHKYSILSMDKLPLIHKDKLWTRLYPQFSPQHFLAYSSLILVLWSFISIYWSNNQSISLFRSLKLFEFFLLSIYVAFRVIPQLTHTKCSTPAPSENVPRGTIDNNSIPGMFHVEHLNGVETFLKDTFKLLIFGGVINSILAIWQFLAQSSTGLSFLKESVLSPNIDGVAKIILFGHKMIRVYGFFPHPNVLGGFLLLTIVLTIYYDQMFHTCPINAKCSTPAPSENVPRGTIDNSSIPGMFHVEHLKGGETLLSWKNTLLAIQIIALILTFSKSALIALLITLLYIALVHRHKRSASLAESRWTPAPSENVPRGTFIEEPTKKLMPWKKMFHACPVNLKCSTWNISEFARMEHLIKLSLITFFALFAVISIFPNLSPIHIQSLEQREMLSIVPRGTIADNPILGIGQGQLVWSMRNNPDLLDWQFQPVHNVFVLIWSELGIVGLILFVLMLCKIFRACPVNSKCSTPAPSNVPRGTLIGNRNVHPELQTVFQGILLGFTFIMLFDHYLWDIQQGQITLWLVIGLVHGLSLTTSIKSDDISL